MDIGREKLQTRAESIVGTLLQIDPEPERRKLGPLIVEFSGLPNSGKTPAIEIVRHFFNHLGLRVLAPSEGASKRNPLVLRQDLVAFNVWSGMYALSEILLEANSLRPSNLVILDRGLFDAICLLYWQQRQGKLSAKEFQTIRDFFLLERWKRQIARVFLFTCSAETSLKREQEGKLIERPGKTIVTKETLPELLTSYAKMKEQLEPAFHISEYSTDGEKDIEKVASKVVDEILSELQLKIRHLQLSSSC